MSATVTENLQGEDLHPLEESDGVQKLLDAGFDVKAVASQIGRDAHWVYRRAQLTKLTET